MVVIDVKAKRTPSLNTELAKLMHRGEQATQKIWTKTEYKHAETRVRQRTKLEMDSKLKSADVQEEDLLPDKSSTTIDFVIESNHKCTPGNDKIKIRKKPPDLGNLSLTKNSSLTLNLLLDATIPLVQDDNNPLNRGIKSTKIPRTLPPTPIIGQTIPNKTYNIQYE